MDLKPSNKIIIIIDSDEEEVEDKKTVISEPKIEPIEISDSEDAANSLPVKLEISKKERIHSEDITSSPSVKFKIPKYNPGDKKPSTDVENPMYEGNVYGGVEEDLSQFEADSLLQRLKQRLSKSNDVEEQQSLQRLIMKRRKTIVKKFNKKKERENCSFRMRVTSDGFMLKDTSTGSIGSNFWRQRLELEPSETETVPLDPRVRSLSRAERASNRGKIREDKFRKIYGDLGETRQHQKEKKREKALTRREHKNIGNFKLEKLDLRTHVESRDTKKVKQEKKKVKQEIKKNLEEIKRESGLAEKLGPSNKGFNMLIAMGFTPGSGLGKEGEGRKEPIGIHVRRGKKGLGE